MSFFRFLGTPFAAKNTARDEGGRCVSMQTLALVSLCLLTHSMRKAGVKEISQLFDLRSRP